MNRRAGFTIVEMLIVVTILAMLTGILIPVLQNGTAMGRDGRRAADLKVVQAALEAYKDQNGSYPTTNGEWWGDPPNYGSKGYTNSGYIPGLVPSLLPSLPSDPNPDYPRDSAGYVYKSDGSDYKFIANETPESFPAYNQFHDPSRPDSAWQISTPAAYNW